MRPIETKYNGYTFRSRLEARWAAFFDILEWRWEYEPTEFDGWVPDFVLFGKKQNVFVEVKPVSSFPQHVADKIDLSGCQDEVLILGMTFPIVNEYGEYLGWLRESYCYEDRLMWAWDHAAIRFRQGIPRNEWGFCHETQSYRCRITGEYDGNSWGSCWTDSRTHRVYSDIELTKMAWVKACEMTRYRR